MKNDNDMKWQVLVAADEARRQGYMNTYHALLQVLEALRDTSDQTPFSLNKLQRGLPDEVVH